MDEHDPKYCDPGRTKDSRRTSPDSVLDGPERKEKSIHYCYGEEIRGHYVVFCVGRADATKAFVVLAREGHECGERMGGCKHWKKLLEAYESEVLNEAQRTDMEWYRRNTANGDPQCLSGAARCAYLQPEENHQHSARSGEVWYHELGNGYEPLLLFRDTPS
jgi:hypothetical protein